MSGNVTIFLEDEEEGLDQESEALETCKEYKKKDAVIVNHFFQKQLTKIASDGAVVAKQPQRGRPETIAIKCYAKLCSKVKLTVNTIDDSLKNDFEEDNFNIPPKQTSEFANFVRDFFDRNDGPNKSQVLYMPDIVRDRIIVITKSSDDFSKAEKFKELQLLNNGISTNQEKSTSRRSGYSDRDKEEEEPSHYEEMESMDTQPPLEDSFAKTLQGSFVLKVYKASILRLRVDAIVNAANDTMSHGGGVAYVISQGAGQKLDEESKQYVNNRGKVRVTENIVSTAGKLNYKGVIHAVGPMWHYYWDKVKCLDDLYDCLLKIFDRCNERKFKTVGIPAISAGIFGVPKALCADMYVKAAVDYSIRIQSGERKYPTEFHFIDVDEKILELVKESFKNWERDPAMLDQRRTVPAYLDRHPHLKRNNHGYQGQKFVKGQDFVGGGRNSNNWQGGQGHWKDNNLGRDQRPGSSEDRSHSPDSLYVKKLPDEKFRWGGAFKQYRIGHMTVKIFSADVTKSSNMDAIVYGMQEGESPDSSSGYMAKCLREKGGSKYTNSLRKTLKGKQLKVLDVVDCEGGDLKVKFVIHAVLKKVIDASNCEVRQYRQVVIKILDHCNNQRLEKVVLPMIGTGTIQTNKGKLERCVEAMLKGFTQFVSNRPSSCFPKEIHLVNKFQDVTSLLCQVFDKASSTTNRSRSPRSNDTGTRPKSPRRSTSNHSRNGSREEKKKSPRYDKETYRDQSPTTGRSLNSEKSRGLRKSYSKSGSVTMNNDSARTGNKSLDPSARPKMPLPKPKPVQDSENDYDTVGYSNVPDDEEEEGIYDTVGDDDGGIKPEGSGTGNGSMDATNPAVKKDTSSGNLVFLDDA